MKIISVALLAILVLAACNRNLLTGSKLTLDNYNQITTGMSKAQVEKNLGTTNVDGDERHAHLQEDDLALRRRTEVRPNYV